MKGRAKEALGEGEDMELLMQMAEMWGAYIGDEVGKQSLKWAWMEECCGGGESFSFSSSSHCISWLLCHE